jgi:hypothetical protein
VQNITVCPISAARQNSRDFDHSFNKVLSIVSDHRFQSLNPVRNTLWSSSKVTLSHTSVSARIIASAPQISDSVMLSSPIQRTRSHTGSDQVNKVDGPVSQASFGQLPAIFPHVMHSAMWPLNFHPLFDPVSASLIALPVDAFQCLINEVVLIIFLSLS